MKFYFKITIFFISIFVFFTIDSTLVKAACDPTICTITGSIEITAKTLNGDGTFGYEVRTDNVSTDTTIVNVQTSGGIGTKTVILHLATANSGIPIIPGGGVVHIILPNGWNGTSLGNVNQGCSGDSINSTCTFYYSQRVYLKIIKETNGQDGTYRYNIYAPDFIGARLPVGENYDGNPPNIGITTKNGQGSSELIDMGYPGAFYHRLQFSYPFSFQQTIGSASFNITEINSQLSNVAKYNSATCDYPNYTNVDENGKTANNKVTIHLDFDHQTNSNIITCTFQSDSFPSASEQGYLIIKEIIPQGAPQVRQGTRIGNGTLQEISSFSTRTGETFNFNISPTPSKLSVTTSYTCLTNNKVSNFYTSSISPCFYSPYDFYFNNNVFNGNTDLYSPPGSNVIKLDPSSDYTIVQDVPAGWKFISADCDDQTSVNTVNGVTNITVLSGISEKPTTCTFYNIRTETPEQTGLKIKTITTGGDGIFSYTAAGPMNSYSPSVTTYDGSGSTGLIASETGFYDVTEQVPPGFTFNSASCDDDTSTSKGFKNGVIEVAVDLGKITTCTFTNTKNTGVTITNSAGGGGSGGGGGGSAPAPQNSLRKPSDQPAF